MRKKVVYLSVFVSAYLLCPRPLLSAESGNTQKPVLSFSQFYTRVFEHYPRLKKENARLELAIAERMKAESKFWPRFYGTFSMTQSDDPVYVFGSLLRQGRFSSDNFLIPRLNNPASYQDFHYAVGGEMVIFDFFQTALAARSMHAKAMSAELERDYVKMETLLIATETYLGAIYLERNQSRLERAVSESEADFRRTENLNKLGLILGADYYSAKVTRSRLMQQRNEAREELAGLYVVMNILMGQDPSAEITLDSTYEEPFPRKKEVRNIFFEALQKRPDYIALDLLLKAQESDLLRQRMSVFPTFKIFAEAEKDNRNFRDFGKAEGNNFSMGFIGSMDLFEPSYAARIKASEELSRVFQAEKDGLKDMILRSVTEERGRYEVYSQNLPLARQMHHDASKAEGLMRPLFQEGRKSIADLMRSRLTAVEASRNYFELLYKSDTTWLRLNYVLGRLENKDLEFISDRFKRK